MELSETALNASLLCSCRIFFLFLKIFWELLWCLWTWTCMKLPLLQARVDYDFSPAIFIELSNFWCELLTIVLGCMLMSSDVSGAQLAGRRGKGLPCLFLKIEKIALIMEKNALIVFIRGSNVHCSSNALIENNVLRLPRRKKSKILLCRAFFHVL